MKEMIGFGILAVGGYLLYEYFFPTATPTLTRGDITNPTPSRPTASNSSVSSISNVVSNGNASGSVGMTRNVLNLDDRTRQLLASRTNTRNLRGLGVITERGAMLYAQNSTAARFMGSKPRATTAYSNAGERFLRGA